MAASRLGMHSKSFRRLEYLTGELGPSPKSQHGKSIKYKGAVNAKILKAILPLGPLRLSVYWIGSFAILTFVWFFISFPVYYLAMRLYPAAFYLRKVR